MISPRFTLVCSCILAILGGNAAGSQQQRRGRTPAYFQALRAKEDQENVTRAVLMNGLTVIIEEMPILPLAALVLSVRAGHSSGDRPELAESFAAAIQEGSDIPVNIRRLGGSLAVDVTAEKTIFRCLVPAEKANEAVEVLSGLLKPIRVTEEQLAVTNVVLSNRLAAGSPGSWSLDRRELWELAYPGVGARAVQRELESLPDLQPTLTPQGLLDYQGANFSPGNSLLSVSGAVFREDLLRLTVEHFGSIEARKAPDKAGRPAQTAAESQSFAYRQTRRDRLSTAISFGFRVPAENCEDFSPLQVLAAILGRGRASWIELASTSSSSVLWSEAGLTCAGEIALIEIVVQPDPGKVDAAETSVLAAIRALQEIGPSAKDLDRAKALLLTDFYQQSENLLSRAASIAEWQIRGDYRNLWKIPQRICAVTEKEVQQLASRHFLLSNLSLLEGFPISAEPRNFDRQSLLQTLDLLVPVASQALVTEELSLRKEPGTSSLQPQEFQPKYLKYDLRKTSVLRGPDIFLEERHTVPLVHLGFFWSGGRLQESSENRGITEVALRSLLRKIMTEDGHRGWNRTEGLGGTVEVVNEEDFFGFQFPVRSSRLSEAIQDAIGWRSKLDLREEDVALEKARVNALRVRERELRDAEALFEVRGRLYGDHPYAWSRYGEPETVSELSKEQVQAWADRLLKEFHPVILIQGDVDGTAFLPELIPALSNSRLQSKPPVSKQLPEDREAYLLVEQDGGIWLGFQGPVRGSRDAWVVDVFQGLFSLWGGRLPVEGARVDLLTDVRFGHETLQNGGGIFFAANTPNERHPEVKEFLPARLADWNKVEIRREDLLVGLVHTLTQFYSRQQSGAGYLRELARDLTAGEKSSFQDEYVSTVKGVTIEEIRDLGRRLFRPAVKTDPDVNP